MEDKRYKLRSKKTECTIPVQLHLAIEEDFMDALRPSTSRQVFYFFYLFIGGFTSLSTLYRSYHDG